MAVQTLPARLVIKKSAIKGAGQGVFTAQEKTLERDLIFGPYGGAKIHNERKAEKSGYCWQVVVVS
jgi:hypothetical protein